MGRCAPNPSQRLRTILCPPNAATWGTVRNERARSRCYTTGRASLAAGATDVTSALHGSAGARVAQAQLGPRSRVGSDRLLPASCRCTSAVGMGHADESPGQLP